MKRILFALLFLLAAAPAMAWWNDEWSARKAFTLNTAADGADLKEGLANAPALIRLHAGNFDFLAAREDGADLRVIAGDDKTPLRFHIERFDSLGEQALIWVQLPTVPAATAQLKIWLYSGNDNAAPASDPAGSFDPSHVLVYHFDEADGPPRDATGYATHAGAFDGTRVAGAAIGGGLRFAGESILTVPAAPALKFTPANGFAAALWLKPEAGEARNATLLSAGGALALNLREGMLEVRVGDIVLAGPELAAGIWSHVAVSLGAGVTLYVNGEAVARDAAARMVDARVDLVLGRGYLGEMDELVVSNLARGADWMRFAARTQGADGARVLVPGEDELAEGDGGHASYVGIILRNVTLDGWVVIVILMIMLAISAMVMVAKSLVISRTDKANREFIAAFHALGGGDTGKLDSDDDPDDADLRDSDLLTAMFGRHDHYQQSSLYRIYHIGIQELKHRFGDAGSGELSPQALGAIRATLDGALVRENQKLNNLMVLLTIAISGGPFLGLLGTVIGVMITFAAIAAAGDVNVNAIAPGIAAALLATVAGLGVAIPALFGYNYLATRIKKVNADMQVFVEEFMAKAAERYSR
jgi:biopolymer transport protein ExbB